MGACHVLLRNEEDEQEDNLMKQKDCLVLLFLICTLNCPSQPQAIHYVCLHQPSVF